MNFTAPDRKHLRQRCPWPVTVAAVTVVLLVLFYAYDTTTFADNSRVIQGYSHIELSSSESRLSDTHHLIPLLYKPFVHPVDASKFVNHDGQTYELTEPPRFTEPLGKKVLILDVDTRPLNGEGGMLNETMQYDSITHQTAGMLNHYLYAMVHGYEYKFIQSPAYTDRHQTWVKVPMIREALKSYDYVVFLDSDAVFPHTHLPVEWLFNYWNIREETLLAMALDPDQPFNKDSRGNTNLNTGFIIAQASPRTTEMLNVWEDCVTDTKFEKCSKWRYEWSHEQAAFSDFMRYEYERGTEVIELACTEANGYPQKADSGCSGEFVRHFWLGKELVADALRDTVSRYMALRLHETFRDYIDVSMVNASNKTLPLHAGERVIV
ncbi:hypothetical protein BGW36DRAFT_312173 [Talaromyces proteolyticus]|uniref:Nucleotide-diphospho-sugar transferase domain-containing protein n=1 Tax=Talaromyces proteolyticus TaxID=1131652 RepID=A0AAD4KX63_9EURO|nr:uncharacterized protein BGW36DRAFT_312173 [Talaromyces proteolyticus]KAH8703180.1 hypothetical protein BGW36DRAFT_312173 [Talaromyces proteolyticus]